MTKYSIAKTYEETLEFLLERTHYYSKKRWCTESEHDPGLTTLQLLANALALMEEEYLVLLDKPSVFTSEPYSSWQPIHGKQGMLHFKPHFVAPTKKDFETLPAVSEDIRHMAEKIPGVKSAWVHKAKPEDTVLFIEFAEVMPGIKNDGSSDVEISDEQKTNILHSLSLRLQKSQGLCQAVLPVREALAFPLSMKVALQCELCEINGNSMQQKDIPAKIATIMTAVEEFLHSDSDAKTCFQLVDLQAYLEKVTSVRCSPVSSDNDGNEKNFQAYEQITLSEKQNYFKVTEWHFSLEHLGHMRNATFDEILIAKHLHSISNLREVWTEQWFEPEHENFSQENDSIALSKQEEADKINIHTQFPSCYNLDSKSEDISAKSLQMQGWLLLFEQLLADMAKPLNSLDRYFQFCPLEPAGFVGETLHPSLSKLAAVEKYQEMLVAMTDREKHFSQLPRMMLEYLAALQGEETWIYYEGMEEYINEEKVKKSLDEENLAFWLRGLAHYNGHRLTNNRRLGVGRFELGGGILEERLSLLLRPLHPFAPKLPQRYFNIWFGPNPITGEDEFRCYILDSEKNIRIICDIMSPTPEEAERVALMVLHYAKFPEQYMLEGETVRISWLAKLPGLHSYVEASRQIQECREWVKTLLAPWVKVVSYEELGEHLPYCIAVLVAEEDVAQKHRETLEIGIRQHIPAHIYPRIFFLNQNDKKRVDLLFHEADGSGFATEHSRFLELRKILQKYEQGILEYKGRVQCQNLIMTK